ncbi:MAG: hypothetical protein F4Y22_14290 [Gammaproteobacteria bacterium]|nr:hypothetical protein [Gammaproteobacteria bacterium]MYH47049.1 hypothetical protein [Gammaproteobacteria bacterium]MYL14994.1 hypothetical protein [Gammaproteobacteria bacterium]
MNSDRLRWPVFPMLLVAAAFGFAAEDYGPGEQYQYWLELEAADQTYADRSLEIGRHQAFLEFLGQGSVVFRDGPVNALELYSSESFSGAEISWEAHYIDVSRAGDLGLSAGPLVIINPSDDPDQDLYGHLISIWRKQGIRWELMADLAVLIPGYLSMDVQPNFEDTRPVLEETAPPFAALSDPNPMETLVEADLTFGRSINFRGGRRALLRWGMENSRVYLPGMAPAVGAEDASTVYGAFLDTQLEATIPIALNHVGGFLAASQELGYSYGTMQEEGATEEAGFRANYLRFWRLNTTGEWRIAVEVLSPY